MRGEWPQASELMTPDPLVANVNDTLSSALGTMRAKRIHELPVLKDRKLSGMVALDALGRRHTMALSTKVEHVMVLAPTFSPGHSFPELAERLLASGRRAGCVVDPRTGKLLGVLSRTDLVRALPELPQLAERSVVEAMSPVTYQVPAKEPVRTLMGHFRELEEHPLPVVDRDGRLVGAVGLTDVGNHLWRPMEGDKRDPSPAPLPDGVLVESIMTRPALTISRGASAGEAARIMTKNRTSTVFVAENGQLLGIVSQADLLGLAVRHAPSEAGVFLQISGLGQGTDPMLVSDLDAVLSKGLKRVARSEAPRMLSVHVASHASQGLGSMTVEARLHGQSRIFSASRTDFNLLKAAADVMDELERQVRGVREEGRDRSRSLPRRSVAGREAELVPDPALEEKLPDSLRGSSAPSTRRASARRPRA